MQGYNFAATLFGMISMALAFTYLYFPGHVMMVDIISLDIFASLSNLLLLPLLLVLLLFLPNPVLVRVLLSSYVAAAADIHTATFQ